MLGASGKSVELLDDVGVVAFVSVADCDVVFEAGVAASDCEADDGADCASVCAGADCWPDAALSISGVQQIRIAKIRLHVRVNQLGIGISPIAEELQRSLRSARARLETIGIGYAEDSKTLQRLLNILTHIEQFVHLSQLEDKRDLR